MKKLISIYATLFILVLNSYGLNELQNTVTFASIEKAKDLLTTEDEFTRSWSKFDIDIRMKKANSKREDLFKLISDQVRAWSSSEEKTISKILKDIDATISKLNYKLDFPEQVYFIKTTAKEEFDAQGYTRANYVVFKEGTISKKGFKKTLIHELFHILSRNNPAFRSAMYQTIGFSLMPPIGYPETLKDYRITNPDATQTDSYIPIQAHGQDIEAMMILYSTKKYDSGGIMDYLSIGFLCVSGDSIKTVELKNEKPNIYNMKQVAGFFEKVGQNTPYIIHPEEILAENFTFVLLGKKDVPNPEILQKIEAILLQEE